MKEFQSLERARLDAPVVVLTENTPEALDRALVAFKKLLTRSGVFREMKHRAYYVPPSEARRIKSKAARKRNAKRAAKAAAIEARYGDSKRPYRG